MKVNRFITLSGSIFIHTECPDMFARNFFLLIFENLLSLRFSIVKLKSCFKRQSVHWLINSFKPGFPFVGT